MTTKNLFMKLTSIVLDCILLESCSAHINPLLNQNNIDELKSYYSLTLDDKTQICLKFYANDKFVVLTDSLRNFCEKQLQDNYQFLSKNRQDIMQGATFNDFRDVRVWQMYLN